MSTVELADSSAELRDLVSKAENGELVRITREGRVVATLVPVAVSSEKVSEAVGRILTRREKIQREGRGISVADALAARDEGRR